MVKRPGTDEEGLTYRESLFVEAFLFHNCSRLRAFREAGYRAKTEEQERAAAGRVMRRPQVRAALERRRNEIAMGAAEVLQRLADKARASLEDCHDAEGKFSIRLARETGVIHQLTSIEHRPDGSVKVALESQKSCLDSLARYHGLLADVVLTQNIPKDEDGLNAMLLYELRRVRGALPDAAKLALERFEQAQRLLPATTTKGGGTE